MKCIYERFLLMQECSLHIYFIHGFIIMLSCVSYSCWLLLMSACLVCVKWIDMDSVIDLQLVKQLTCLRPFSCSVILRNSNNKHQEGPSIKIMLLSRHMHVGWDFIPLFGNCLSSSIIHL